MTTINQALLIIYASQNGKVLWHPVLPDDVPEWLKSPDIVGRLVAGEMCQDCAEGDKGSLWYRAEPCTAC